MKLERDRYLDGMRRRAKDFVRYWGMTGKMSDEVEQHIVTVAKVSWDEGYRQGSMTNQSELPF